MGAVYTVDLDKHPVQGSYLGREVEVCFHYDTSRTLRGVVVRDDMEHPWVTIIKVEDRFLLGSECHYCLPLEAEP